MPVYGREVCLSVRSFPSFSCACLCVAEIRSECEYVLTGGRDGGRRSVRNFLACEGRL